MKILLETLKVSPDNIVSSDKRIEMTTAPVTENDNLNQEVIQWGYQYLVSHGYTLKNTLPEIVKNTPWSCVARFATSAGDIYLKQTPTLIAEADIIQILHDQFAASVPAIIARNVKLNCFLMKDAGRPLREMLKQKFDVNLLCKAINQFTTLQLTVADYIDIFLDRGAPDWRLENFPALFKQCLSHKDLLSAEGLSAIEMNKLENLLPTISNLCKELSCYAIKPTIVQPDFHDNNLLIDDVSQHITLIDLGEIAISHPFFSLVTFLRQAKKHHSLTEEDEAYLQLKEACFANYMQAASRKHLSDAFAIAQILWFVYGALAGDRLMTACGQEKLMAFQPGKHGETFKELLAACDLL